MESNHTETDIASHEQHASYFVLRWVLAILCCSVVHLAIKYSVWMWRVFTRSSQSIVLEDGVHINSYCSKEEPVKSYYYDGVNTILDAFYRGLNISKNKKFIGFRSFPKGPYRWLTYEDIHRRVKLYGSGLMKIGVVRGQGTRIGVFSSNNVEYTIHDLACYLYSMIPVPLYSTLGVEALTYIIRQAELDTIMCDKSNKIEKLLELVKDHSEIKINNMILIEQVDTFVELKKQASELGIRLFQFTDILELGDPDDADTFPCEPEDIAVILYTSGTTGNPKGVMTTHLSWIATVNGAARVVEQNGKKPFSPNNRLISYLPLAHGMERCLEINQMCMGGSIGIFGGNPKELMEDCKEIQPTIFPMVPRVNTSYIFRVMVKIARCPMFPDWYRSMVFAIPRRRVGGKVRLIVLGAAPVSPKVKRFTQVALGCTVIEGYGLSEVISTASLTSMTDRTHAHVGSPTPDLMIKLADVPDMEYFAKDNQGEVCMKGHSVMGGYYKDPERTKEAIDSDGWFHSGDIGKWNPDNTLSIIDRKKDLFKLAQGEYIAPEKIESIYVQVSFISQVFVYGDSLRSQLVAIVFPDPVELKKKFNRKEDIEELCKDTTVEKQVHNAMLSMGKRRGLFGFEQVKAIRLWPTLMTLEDGFLTPTFKCCRAPTKKHFGAVIKELYSGLGEDF